MLEALVLTALLFQIPTFERPPMMPGTTVDSFKLAVYVFTTTDCPISNRYAPEIQRLAAKFRPEASFTLVYPVPTDSPAMIREHIKKYGYSLQYVRDVDQRLVRMTGARVLPEVAVMQGSNLLYRGRIDDRYIEFGKERIAPTTRELEDALMSAATGKPIAVKETQAVGCILSDLVK